MAANMFDKAKASTSKPTKSKSKQKKEIDVEDLRTYAALKRAEKVIETMLKTLGSQVNEQALNAFIEQDKPDSITGKDRDTDASLQLKKRSSKSALSDQEVKVLAELGISYEKSADSKFYINPQYAEDQDLLGKVSEALEGIVPDDFIKHTGEKYVTTNSSLQETFHKCDEDNLREILPIVSVQATRAKFGGTHEDMLEILDDVLKED